ncbi:MAG: hypothetical protein HZA93_20715 [Verrucomicrobia bacterium]|nr:hypothetical protein [Verrucomicrobiota bacterium]
MLKTVVASRFIQPMGSGKTTPSLIGCTQADESEIELVVKFAAGCESRYRGLVTEALVAMIAADLDLPVPEPFLVDVAGEFAATIPESSERHKQAKRHALASIGLNFGSRKLPPGFGVYPKNKRLPKSLETTAAEILALDYFLANPDRVVANPNCLIKGNQIAIYDHELSLMTDGLIGWLPPWEVGGIVLPKNLNERQQHIFLEEVRGSEPDFSRFVGAFEGISDARLEEYRAAIPPNWIGDGRSLNTMLDYVRSLRQNLEAATRLLEAALS